ncbi:hypothetical protein [Anaerosporobacter sp.]|uniref:hypothetical protein n=1 Tax=Anaerosporobacter sp. TaxID=1872529 RepID=UPI00286ECC1E|nr:hypothetical protein [Anaerosporobacter sp.]
MNGEELPGVMKQSFCIFFNNGEIWIEHLDGIYGYTNLALEKLELDFQQFKRPSMPSVMAVNLEETFITDTLIQSITEKLLYGSKQFRKVVFIGVSRQKAKEIKKALGKPNFLVSFINDFEKAKEWLISPIEVHDGGRKNLDCE